VSIPFVHPLPEDFVLRLVAHTSTFDGGQPFTLRIGEESKTFPLPPLPQEISLPIDRIHHARSIGIDVPIPAVPSTRGYHDDDRTSGIALTEIRIDSMKTKRMYRNNPATSGNAK
jgi:hypothetical protein